MEKQKLAFSRVGSRGWRPQDHPKWKTHVFRGSVGRGGHGALGSPGGGGGPKKNKPTLFQPDQCAVFVPRSSLTHPLLKLQLTLDSSHLCHWNPLVLFVVLHSFLLCCCKTWHCPGDTSELGTVIVLQGFSPFLSSHSSWQNEEKFEGIILGSSHELPTAADPSSCSVT